MLIAGPNLSLDRTVTIDELRPGEVLRFAEARVTPGGKGVNVARAARLLGLRALLVGFTPGRTGHAVGRLLADEEIWLVPVPTEGEVRCATIVLERAGRVTVLNEPGPPAAARDWAAYFRAVERRLPGHRVLVCIGSVPADSPDDAYGTLVRAGRAASVEVLVDAAGPVLAAALEAGPHFVAPNLAEAEGVLLGHRSAPVDDTSANLRGRALDAAVGLRKRGASVAVVTAGQAGLAVSSAERAMWVPSLDVVARNPIGAGDSFVAGFGGAIEHGESLEAAAIAGAAAAAASVETELPGYMSPDRVRLFTERIRTLCFET